MPGAPHAMPGAPHAVPRHCPCLACLRATRNPQIFSKKGVGCIECWATKWLAMPFRMPVSSPSLPTRVPFVVEPAMAPRAGGYANNEQGPPRPKLRQNPLRSPASSGASSATQRNRRVGCDSYKINWCSFLARHSCGSDGARQEGCSRLGRTGDSL